MSLFWRAAIVAVVIFGTVLVVIGILGILRIVAGGVLENRRQKQRQQLEDVRVANITACLDEELAVVLRSPGTGRSREDYRHAPDLRPGRRPAWKPSPAATTTSATPHGRLTTRATGRAARTTATPSPSPRPWRRSPAPNASAATRN